MRLDLLVFAPHPDDAELGLGGTLARLAREGRRTGIVDLTRGELGTKGTPQQRAAEAEQAGGILGLAVRENLDLGDGRLVDTPDLRGEVAACMRRHAPRVVATIYEHDRHPDHQAAARLVRGAYMWARLPRAPVDGEACYPTRLLYYFVHDLAETYAVHDISEDFATKQRAVEAYRSQFVDEDLPAGYRYVGTRDYLRTFEAAGRFFGARIGTEYGEPLLTEGVARVADVLNY